MSPFIPFPPYREATNVSFFICVITDRSYTNDIYVCLSVSLHIYLSPFFSLLLTQAVTSQTSLLHFFFHTIADFKDLIGFLILVTFVLILFQTYRKAVRIV